jgi:hypothetical protein
VRPADSGSESFWVNPHDAVQPTEQRPEARNSDESKSRFTALRNRKPSAAMTLVLYLAALYFITRSSAIPLKTLTWMLITLFFTIGVFVGLASLTVTPEAAYGLGGLGSVVGMVASVGAGLKHMQSHKRPTS